MVMYSLYLVRKCLTCNLYKVRLNIKPMKINLSDVMFVIVFFNKNCLQDTCINVITAVYISYLVIIIILVLYNIAKSFISLIDFPFTL